MAQKYYIADMNSYVTLERGLLAHEADRLAGMYRIHGVQVQISPEKPADDFAGSTAPVAPAASAAPAPATDVDLSGCWDSEGRWIG